MEDYQPGVVRACVPTCVIMSMQLLRGQDTRSPEEGHKLKANLAIGGAGRHGDDHQDGSGGKIHSGTLLYTGNEPLPRYGRSLGLQSQH